MSTVASWRVFSSSTLNSRKLPRSRKSRHPIIREALKLVGVQERNLEITSMADIPAGTGLGSSGSFTTALLKAFHALRKNLVHPAELAEQACQIELEKLRRADRETGSIHRGLRRYHLFQVPARMARSRRGR